TACSDRRIPPRPRSIQSTRSSDRTQNVMGMVAYSAKAAGASCRISMAMANLPGGVRRRLGVVPHRLERPYLAIGKGAQEVGIALGIQRAGPDDLGAGQVG